MIFLISFIIIYFIPIINSSYNPIPYGSMIISTTRTISVLPLNDYTTTDKLTTIFTANKTETILYTMFDSKSRELYVLFLKTTNNLVYISKLLSLDKLDSIQYEIPISGNLTDSNKLISFSSDINNKRIFLTDQYGNVTMYSMGGTMKTQLSIPSNIKNHVQSVNYNPIIDRLFILTDSTIDSCKNLDKNNLHCCNSSQILNQLRSITFEPLTMKTYAYVIDERTGIYEVKLNTSTYCPMSIRPLNTIDSYYNKHLIIYENLYISSASGDQSNHNSILIISNATQILRKIPFDTPIVALHISYPNIKSIQTKEDSCFRGLTYHHYRIAMILAAIFGTIMGIFMCFNILFCLDFCMTKRIIKDLKNQIPHNYLEDRWNKLVEEKYAKLALERNRKKDDPVSKRKSLTGSSRKIITTADNLLSSNGLENLQLPNPLPRISAYLRRKSESYLNRRRSDDYRSVSASQNVPRDGIGSIKEEPQKNVPQNHDRHVAFKTEGELL